MRLVVVGLCLLVSLVSSAVAHAESAVLRCTPGPVLFDPPAGDVPANWPAFRHLAGSSEYREWSGVRLVRVRDGAVIPSAVASGHLGGLAPREDLVPGEEYDLFQPHCLGEAERATRYRAVAPIVGPTRLGTASVSRVYATNNERGTTNRFYFVEVLLEPDPIFADEPWASSTWNAEVDRVAPTLMGSFLNYPSTRVIVDCGSGTGVEVGDHSLRVVAYPIFDAVRFATPEVTLRITTEACSDALRVESTTLRPLTPEEIGYWDAPEMDASVPSDCGPSMDGGRLCTTTERDTNSNCAVAPGRRAGFGPWAILIVATIALARARRRD